MHQLRDNLTLWTRGQVEQGQTFSSRRIVRVSTIDGLFVLAMLEWTKVVVLAMIALLLWSTPSRRDVVPATVGFKESDLQLEIWSRAWSGVLHTLPVRNVKSSRIAPLAERNHMEFKMTIIYVPAEKTERMRMVVSFNL